MPPTTLRRAALLCAALALLASIGGGARAALVEVDDLVLRADGGFQPRHLPRHRFAPIGFHGYVDLAAKGGGPPPSLRRAVVDFDRDGRISAGGLPVCRPARIEAASTADARRICRRAIVGRGRLEATISLPRGPVDVASALTIFNGPRQGGRPTAVVHARTVVPLTLTYAIVVPIRKRRGEFRYRAVLDLPPIAAGLGTITRVEVRIGRRYRARGSRRSYVSARCRDGILRTHGRFEFAGGLIVDGSVEKFCRAR